jgi:hypothetical protein
VPDPTSPEPPEESDSRPALDTLEGTLILAFGRQRPNIHEDQRVTCPQCTEIAGKRSRWCWSCGFDFDRARLGRFHPLKLLALSLAANVMLAGLLGAVWLRSG